MQGQNQARGCTGSRVTASSAIRVRGTGRGCGSGVVAGGEGAWMRLRSESLGANMRFS